MLALRLLGALTLLVVAPALGLFAFIALLLTDLAWALFGRRRLPADTLPDTSAVSIVIPNWNGRDLLERYLPSVVAATSGNRRNEVIVVDNASEDGSADYLRGNFPNVRVLQLPRNEGFGGGSNAGFEAATNDIVLLLNSDMRVDPGIVEPLLAGFTDEKVFAVSCQIFFSDPAKKREETGLTQFWWERGRLRVRHREDDKLTRAFPCAYGGGGSTAFDRRKFLELGGFDPLLAPFYLEDTDVGYMAWKRGWKILYEPRSIVYHEHRGTIGKRFSSAYIASVLKKNFLLFAWKNIHDWRSLAGSIVHAATDAIFCAVAGDSPERGNARGLFRAVGQLFQAMQARARARSLAAVSDREAFRRPLGGYFRDRFAPMPANPDRLSVLFVSPYPICPPVHGGGVFMYQTSRELARLSDLNLIVLLEDATQKDAHADLVAQCRSAEFLVRPKGTQQQFATILPHAVVEFRNDDLAWTIHRQIYLQDVDIVQLEYMPIGQYGEDYERIGSFLFEHDVYFQSIRRQLPGMTGGTKTAKARLEYLRALRYELRLLNRFDRVQVCSADNRRYLESFLPELAPRLDDRTRAGIDTSRYEFRTSGREPDTMLFVGSFRHQPNQEGLTWFVKEVLPRVVRSRPAAGLVVVGADLPPRHTFPGEDSIELRGFVEDVREPLGRYSVFICPIQSGSGVRVKLLEAFATGIPVVSTRLGAEGLSAVDGEICALADDPGAFAEAIVGLLDNTERAAQLAAAARQFVTETRDMRVLTTELEREYRSVLRQKRSSAASLQESPARQPEHTPHGA